MIDKIDIPGPGTAMALAAAVSIYSAAILEDTSFTECFLWITVLFIIATLVIELMSMIKEKTIAKWTVIILIVLPIIIVVIWAIYFRVICCSIEI